MFRKIKFILPILFCIILSTNYILAINPNNISVENFSEIQNEFSTQQENLNSSYTTSITDYDDPFELSITNIINIILIAVGIVLILLGIAIILKK